MITTKHEGRTGEFLAELPPDREADLLHLLSCPVCQELARESLGASAAVAREAQPVYDRILRTLEARTPGLLRQMEEEAARVQRKMDRLLDSPVDQRRALAASPELRDLAVAERLLLESWELQPASTAFSEEMARLALVIAAQPYAPEQASRVDDVKARASVLVAGAKRLAGNRAEAEQAFRDAAAHLTCPPDSVERAFYCQQLAALRQEQDRDDEAAGLLWRAALIYNENADLLEEGACLAELGFLFFAQDQPHRAVLPLSRACQVLDLHRDASLGVRARLALAVCYASLRDEAKALGALQTARQLYDRVAGSPLQMAHVTWMEGKVALLTGNLEDAPDLLDTARKAFLQHRRLHDSAFAALDLAAALARAGRLKSVRPLIDDVLRVFPADVEQAGVLRMLGMVETALSQRPREGREGMEDLIAGAVARLRSFRRKPLLAFEGMPPAAERKADPQG